MTVSVEIELAAKKAPAKKKVAKYPLLSEMTSTASTIHDR